ncbi:6-phosphogluconolactonase [Oscillatoria sp. FACHB-1407]|uniref:6-phosphogluconolactonase n=1 Tax=Oscillatoria sp. FACHB-1407 TaxID=2692847 RepID=UPI0016849F29|nr:6-phosphogluconolactonase [Oscillatoria sp. FACHB-1407]MBD2460191.1 6-phosphogluconolactonase [Oscillatoria sp. FACHB-1407]
MSRTVEVLPDLGALVQRSLSIVLEQMQQAVAERDIFTIALAGGNTPKPLYEAIAQENLPWDKIHVFWGDERYVPPDHPDSNQGMARRAWLDRVPIPASNIHPIATDAADPAIAAQTHEQLLQDFFPSQVSEFPSLDVVLLGIGDDGHTASLFPHTEALQVSDRLVTVGNKSGEPRITFTAPFINHARCVIFMVTGANKQIALSHILAPTGDSSTYPARLIQPQGQLWWLLDQAAGEQINDFVP